MIIAGTGKDKLKGAKNPDYLEAEDGGDEYIGGTRFSTHNSNNKLVVDTTTENGPSVLVQFLENHMKNVVVLTDSVGCDEGVYTYVTSPQLNAFCD